jgi:hypothetical protein
MKVRIIGDVHGKLHAYFNRIKDVNLSIQLGDFGFKEWDKLRVHKIDSEHHKIIPGNHDDYTRINKDYTFGKDYGDVSWNDFKFFFVRGAFSIDKEWRTPYISWWPEEELSYEELQNVIDLFDKVKPEIMLSHDVPAGPRSVLFESPFKIIDSRTQVALHEMYRIHQPKLWIFAHWHYTLSKQVYDNTTFICLDELDFVDYDIEKSIDENIELINKQIIKIKAKRKPMRW